MAGILDAAAVVFAESGYEAATTNAIAAQAGISPGSLYQFFRNKESIAEGLAGRFLTELREAHTFDTSDIADLSLDDLLDRIVNPLVTLSVATPALKTLFAHSNEVTRPLRNAVAESVEALLKVRAPGLSAMERSLRARVTVDIVKALLVPIIDATGRNRLALVGELRKVLDGYLAPSIAER